MIAPSAASTARIADGPRSPISPRGVRVADIIPSADLLSRVHGEFREMPCLSLTLAQASRLFHLSETVCQTVLERLVAAGVLHARDDGRYVLRAVSR